MKTKYWWLIVLSLLNTGVAFGIPGFGSRHAKHSSVATDEENAGLNTLSRLESLQREVQELRGKIEEQGYQLQQMQEHQKKLTADLEKRLREGSQHKTDPDVTLHDNVISEKINNVVTYEADPLDEEKAYLAAYRLIQNKDYEGALNAFKTMILQAPQGKYTPNAQYWLGEIYLVKGSLGQATDAFNIVYQQFPQHPKAADSLLKLGYIEHTHGQWKRAEALLKQVKNQFPGSTSAQLADARLQKMHQEGHL